MLKRLHELWRKLVPQLEPVHDDPDPDEPESDAEYDDDILDGLNGPNDLYEPNGGQGEAGEYTEDENGEPEYETFSAKHETMTRRARGRSPNSRRAGFVHSPYVRGANLAGRSAPASIEVSNEYNWLSYCPSEGTLTVSELDDGETLGTVEVGVKFLDDRVSPVWTGVIEAIRANREERRRPDDNEPNPAERPFMIESGQNTFIWYRESRRLVLSRDKTEDESGLLMSAGSVTLHVGRLGKDALPLFEHLALHRAGAKHAPQP